MESIEFNDTVETLIDIAMTVGAMRAGYGAPTENSRDVPELLVKWANAFNERHAQTDWGEVEYLETIGTFTADQFFAHRARNAARNPRRRAEILATIEKMSSDPGAHPELTFAYVTGCRDSLEDLLGPKAFEEVWAQSEACARFHELRHRVAASPAVQQVTGYVPAPAERGDDFEAVTTRPSHSSTR